ncbi:MAG: beta strand repeat-containing protein [Luteolibacter sp.]
MKIRSIALKRWLGTFVFTGLASANADVVSSYSFVNPANANGSDAVYPAVFEATTFDPSVTAGNWSRGAGFTAMTSVGLDPDQTMQVAEGNGLADGTDDDMAGAIAADQYLGFTVTANGGNVLNLDSLEFDIQRATRGCNDYSVRSSVDGFATDIPTGLAAGYTDQGITTTLTVQNIDLSDPSFDGLTSIEFRIYLDDRQNNGGGASAVVFDDVVLNGIVVAPGSSIWQVDGDGDWSTMANWSPSVPNAADAAAIFSDTLPITGPLTASLDSAVTIGDLSLSSAQPITIAGPSALTLDGPGLANISASAGSHEISANVTLADPLEVALTTGSALNLSGALSGTSSVTNTGEGQLTVSGDFSGFSGGLSANSGTLEVTGSGTSSDITVNSGGTLSGEGSHTGTLNLSASSTLLADPATGGAFTTGTLSPTSPVLVDTTSAPAGSFDVLNYSTYGGTVATDFVGLSQRLTFADSAGTITATAAGAESINWTALDATNPTFWDSAVSQNWSSTDNLFYGGDSVTFTDTGVGAVSVRSAVAPASVTFTNTSGNDYTLDDVTTNVETISATTGGINVTGDGNSAINTKITGSTNITHSGAGILTLGGGDVDNDFVGTITVDGGGTLRNERLAANINALGDFGNTVSFTNGSIFDVHSSTGTGTVDHTYTGYGTASIVMGDGTTLTNSSPRTLRGMFTDQLEFAGDVTLGGVGRMDIGGDIAVTGTDITITVENETSIVLGASNSGKSIAAWAINAGTLILGSETGLGDTATATIDAGAGISGNLSAGVFTLANDITLNGGMLSANQSSTTDYSGTITVTGGGSLNPGRNTRGVTLSGVLTESGAGGDLVVLETVITNAGTVTIASTLDATGYTGDFILSNTGSFSLENGVILTQDIVVSDIGDNKQVLLPVGSSAEISGGIIVNELDTGLFDFNVVDAADALTVSGVISGSGAAGVTKTGAGTVILSGSNDYTGATTVLDGSLALDGDALSDAGSLIINGGTVAVTGTETVNTLFIGATQQAPGIYTNTEIPAITSGSIEVLDGPAGFASYITGTFANGTVTNQGPNDDDDNDGISNLLEYAIEGEDPTVPNSNIGTYTGDTLSYTKSTTATGLTYAMESSTDLGIADDWEEVADVPDYLTYVNDATTISVTFTLTGTIPPKNFIRLQVIDNN